MNEKQLPPDNELIAHSLQGDTHAFGLLILRYRRLAVSVAYRVSGDTMLADDVAQETFIRIWQKLGTFRPGSSFRGWMYRITTNLTIDALRKRKPTVDISDIPLAAQNEDLETAVIKQEQAAEVKAALMSLPIRSRTALILKEYERLSYQEIAGTLDIPLGTVKSRINSARRHLQTTLTRQLEGY